MNKTKKLLIDITFDILYKKGYCATSQLDILKIAGVTKGAMYHHFDSKNTLVLSTMQHYLDYMLESHWIEPFEDSDKPIQTLTNQISAYLTLYSDENSFSDIQHGCPLSNFILDMSDKDEVFFIYLQSVYSRWQDSIAKALTKAQALKQTQTNFQADDEALFIISCIEGSLGSAKAYNSMEVLEKSFGLLIKYIEKL